MAVSRRYQLDALDRRRELTRRQVLTGMLATAATTAAVSAAGSWVAQGVARAAGALLPPGTRPNPNLPEGVDTMPQIEHIVIYMQENHSFDQYFGMLHRGDGFTLDGNGQPTNSNPDLDDNPFTVFKSPTTCDSIGGDHGWNAEHLAWNGGAMDGFIRASNATNIMGYFDGTELPFYYGLASIFPLCDRWFCSVMGPTHPNRRFLQAGTSAGIVQTSVPEVLATPNAPNGTIWNRLDAHGITWVDYAIDVAEVALWPTSDPSAFTASVQDNIRHYPDDFLADCRNGTLPQVSIIGPGVQDQYDEGSRDVQNGEAYSYSIITAVMGSPRWDKTVLFFTYDENGGGYDHVPPPRAPVPDAIAPRITVPPDQPGDFGQLGPRVPGLVISPYSRPNHVSHVVHDHTSILKFIETKWNLGAITYRDANADDLTDCLDLTNAAFLTPPNVPLPGLPATGSACQPQPRPPTNPYPPPSSATTTTAGSTTTTSAPASDPSVAGRTGVSAGSVSSATPVSATPRFTG